MYAEVNRILHEKYLTEPEKQLRQQNKTPSGKMDLQPGFSEEYSGNSPTIDTSITETRRLCTMSRNTS